MIPSDDIRGQILANIRQYMGIPPSELSAAIYGDICATVMDIVGVASVGIHCGAAIGTVDVSVELQDGEVITISITEADCTVDDSGHLAGRIEVLESKVAILETTLLARLAAHENLIADRIAALSLQVGSRQTR